MGTNGHEQQQRRAGGRGIEDEDLPEDLQPGEDNPLAEALDDAETAGDLEPGELLDEGKTPDQWDDEELEDLRSLPTRSSGLRRPVRDDSSLRSQAPGSLRSLRRGRHGHGADRRARAARDKPGRSAPVTWLVTGVR